MNKRITLILWKRCYPVTLIFKSAVIGIYELKNRLIEEFFLRGYLIESKPPFRIELHFVKCFYSILEKAEGRRELNRVLYQRFERISPKSGYIGRFNRTSGHYQDSAATYRILPPASNRQERQVCDHSPDTRINPEVFLLPGRWKDHKNQSISGNPSPVNTP